MLSNGQDKTKIAEQQAQLDEQQNRLDSQRTELGNQQKKIDSQQDEIDDLTNQINAAKFDLPILKLSSKILLVALVGSMDSFKSQTVMENILNRIKEQETRVAIVDIAGIKVLDSSVAAHLVRIAMASNLMGCNCIISGISPKIASNIVNLGVDISYIKTTNTLEDAIKHAYSVMGLKIVAA